MPWWQSISARTGNCFKSILQGLFIASLTFQKKETQVRKMIRLLLTNVVRL